MDRQVGVSEAGLERHGLIVRYFAWFHHSPHSVGAKHLAHVYQPDEIGRSRHDTPVEKAG